MTLDAILSDRLWRLRNLYAIKDAFAHVGPFIPRESQLWLYRRQWHQNLILKARKRGFSTFISLLGGDRCIFNPNQSMAIVDKTRTDAEGKLDMIRLAHERIGLGVPNLDPDEARSLNQLLHRMNPIVEKSKTRIKWANGSTVEAAVSFRGGNPNFVLVSELGYTAQFHPQRAHEIMTGTLESIQSGGENIAFLESTHKNGRTGLHYQLCRGAMANEAKPADELTPLDMKFHFFPWHADSANQIPLPPSGLILPDEHAAYFTDLREKHSIVLRPEQMLWWSKKKATLNHEMGAEHPSIPSEPFDAPIEGAIYGNLIADLRAKGRVGVRFEIDRRYPVYTFWDEGWRDATAIWAIQVVGQDILVLDWYQANGQPPSHYAEVIRLWQSRYPIAGHYLTHAGGRRSLESAGKSVQDQLVLCGLLNIQVLPVCHRVWDGINVMRELMPRVIFHERTTTRRTGLDGEEVLSGVDHLEAYHKRVPEQGEVVSAEPVHDEHSNSADGLRTFAEAYAAGRIPSHFPRTKEERRKEIYAIMN